MKPDREEVNFKKKKKNSTAAWPVGCFLEWIEYLEVLFAQVLKICNEKRDSTLPCFSSLNRELSRAVWHESVRLKGKKI